MSEKQKLTQEEILKSLDAIIDETMGTDEGSSEDVVKSEESKNENKQANGGEDKIKSGAPMTEEQKAEEAKKAKEKKDKEEKEAKEKAMKESAEKSAQAEADLKKSDDKDADDKKGAKESEDKDADDKKKAKKMKKSLEELAAAGLDQDELELIKAWREENEEAETEEEVVPAVDIAKSVSQAIGAQLEDMKKSFEQKLSAKDDMIKSLSAEVKKLSSQPAHGKQSVDGLETIEKSSASNTEISKSQVLETMLELQKSGKGINSRHIAEFEATRNLSNPQVKALVMEETKKRFSN